MLEIHQVLKRIENLWYIADTWNFVLETGPSAGDYIFDPEYPVEAYFEKTMLGQAGVLSPKSLFFSHAIKSAG